MPIGGYFAPFSSDPVRYNTHLSEYGLETNLVQDKYYAMIEDLGINLLNCTPTDASTENGINDYINSLVLAERHGIGVYVADDNIKGNTSAAQLADRLNLFSRFKSFKGIFICDEPHTGYFYSTATNSTIQEIKNKFKLVNGYNKLTAYVNLYPAVGGGTTEDTLNSTYNRYVQEYIDSCNPEFISFDCYPFTSKNGNSRYCQIFFNALNLIKNKAQENNLPFWGYIGTHEPLNTVPVITENAAPTAAQLYWSTNMHLAYGAKGMQWFTLIEPWFFALEGYQDDDGTYVLTGMDFDRCGLIGANGEPTRHYSNAKAINSWIGKIDSVLMESENCALLAKGTYAKQVSGITAEAYGELSGIEVSNNEDGAIVGVFDYNGKKAYYIVNFSTTYAETVSLNFNAQKSMTVYTEANEYNTAASRYSVTLEAGRAALIVVG